MEWSFFNDLIGGWQWECRQGNMVVMESVRSFPTRSACVLDAYHHGYREADNVASAEASIKRTE